MDIKQLLDPDYKHFNNQVSKTIKGNVITITTSTTSIHKYKIVSTLDGSLKVAVNETVTPLKKYSTKSLYGKPFRVKVRVDTNNRIPKQYVYHYDMQGNFIRKTKY